MSPFTHALCEACYEWLEPGREPVMITPPEQETCCWCGKPTTSGIYYRAEPERMVCKGKHK
jgi:hypothetical protein